jgi:hypothetical protein
VGCLREYLDLSERSRQEAVESCIMSVIIICTLHQQINKYVMGWTCHIDWLWERYTYNFVHKVNERDHLQNLSVEWRIILKMYIKL